LREAKARDAVKEREEEEEKLRKVDTNNLKVVASLHKKWQQQSARELRESAKEARKKDAEAKTAERAAEKQRKQEEREATTTRKLTEQANKAIRTTSRTCVKKP
jgi:hypothetical protein